MNKFPNKTYNLNDDLNIESFKRLLRTIKREKLTFFLITGAITTLGLIYSLIARPIYKGYFDIVVEIEKNKEGSDLSSFLDNSLIKGLNPSVDRLESQQYILKSPSVLMPIFKKVKELKVKEDIRYQNLDYKSWVKKYLNVNFTDGTNILTISYEDNDQKDIIRVLNQISEKYKEYSLRDRQREIDRSLNYLKAQQIIYKKKSEDSLKAFNVFAIKNGLGNIDGFVGLDETSMSNSTMGQDMSIGGTDLSEGLSKKIMSEANLPSIIKYNSNNSSAGQRFNSQFRLLEQFESQFTTLSSRLNPNSKTLRDLQIRIDKLRSSLKRPNKILIEYKNLRKSAQRDESVLTSIESQLGAVKLEKVKQEVPWEIISEPTLEKYRVFPKRKSIVGISFLSSILLGALITYLKEKKQGFIFEIDELKENLNLEPMDILTFESSPMNKQIFRHILSKYKKKTTLGIISKSNNKEIFKQLTTLKDYTFIEIKLFEDDHNLENCDYFIYFVESGKYKKDDIDLLKRYILFLENKFIGWFFIS